MKNVKLIWKSVLNKVDDILTVYTSGLFCKPIMFDKHINYFYSAIDFKSEAKPYLDSYMMAATFDIKSGNKKTVELKISPNTQHLAIPDDWEVNQKGDLIEINTGKYIKKTEKYIECKTIDGKTEYITKEEKTNYYAKILHYYKNEFKIISESPETFIKIYNDARIYSFDTYEIYIPKKSTRKLECKNKKSNEVIWSFNFVGYLYTEIEEKDGIVFFGTAGNGGHFYGLNITDGSIVHDINTHGTIHYSWYKNNICLADENGDLLIYNPKTKAGKCVTLGGGLSLHSGVHFLIEKDLLFTVAYRANKEDRQPTDIYAVCFNLK